MPEPLIVSWSGGKDSALALHALRRSPDYEVVALLTTLTDTYDRVSMHGVRRELLEAQTRSLGLPLRTVQISSGSSNEEYQQRLGRALADACAEGIHTVAYGDLFLEDIRRYREEVLAREEMRAVFPLWGRPTDRLAEEFLRLGFRAVITCVDGEQLDGSFAGREYDGALLHDLPAGVDPCGENGEFHTFVYDGPGFREPVRFRRGGTVVRDNRFHFCDLEGDHDGVVTRTSVSHAGPQHVS